MRCGQTSWDAATAEESRRRGSNRREAHRLDDLHELVHPGVIRGGTPWGWRAPAALHGHAGSGPPRPPHCEDDNRDDGAHADGGRATRSARGANARVGVGEVFLERIDGEERLVGLLLGGADQIDVGEDLHLEGVLRQVHARLAKKPDTSRPLDIMPMRRFRPSSFSRGFVERSALSSSRRSSSICGGWGEGSGERGSSGSAPKDETRWARATRMRRSKRADRGRGTHSRDVHVTRRVVNAAATRVIGSNQRWRRRRRRWASRTATPARGAAPWLPICYENRRCRARARVHRRARRTCASS